MKLYIAVMAATFMVAAQAHPEPANQHSRAVLNVERHVLGSGDPAAFGFGFEQAELVLGNNIYHGAQYMPYFPTAATIWPRVVEVDCVKTQNLKCEGYNWSPAMGRAEYLFVTPRLVEPPVPILVPVPGPERIILKEVPRKKVRE